MRIDGNRIQVHFHHKDGRHGSHSHPHSHGHNHGPAHGGADKADRHRAATLKEDRRKRKPLLRFSLHQTLIAVKFHQTGGVTECVTASQKQWRSMVRNAD